MEEVTRNVSEMAADERRAVELVVGHVLKADQQVTIVVRDGGGLDQGSHRPATGHSAVTAALPDWCDVYRGLSDSQIAAIEADILERADLTRPNR